MTLFDAMKKGARKWVWMLWRFRPTRSPASLQDCGLREILYEQRQESARSQEESKEFHIRSEVSAFHRRARLSGAQKPDHSLPGRGSQSKGHDFSSWPRNGAPGCGPRQDGSVAEGTYRSRSGGVWASDGSKHPACVAGSEKGRACSSAGSPSTISEQRPELTKFNSKRKL